MSLTLSHCAIPVVVPFRDPCHAKTRLGTAITDLARTELAVAMFADTVETLCACGLDVVVAAGTRAAARVAAALGVPAVVDSSEGVGLRGAVDEILAGMSSVDVAVVMADLPALDRNDVTRLLESNFDVTIAASSDGGTGAVMYRNGARIPAHFGVGSAEGHRRTAIEHGYSVRSLLTGGFAFDVDTPADLVRAKTISRVGSNTEQAVYRWLT
jgi:2-phospho-L-lactate guanylyltransferase